PPLFDILTIQHQTLKIQIFRIFNHWISPHFLINHGIITLQTQRSGLQMKKALIVIDYTYDFVADNGKLTCGKPGQAIEKNISTLIEQFIEHNDVVVFANDLHFENDPYHPESKLFPPHNIVGTKGRELYGSVKELYETYKDRVISFDK